MNKLQRNTWIELTFTTLAAIVGIIFIYSLRKLNAQGVVYIVICIVVGGPTMLAGMLLSNKVEAKYDEREKLISRKAFRCSAQTFIVYALLACFVSFFAVGGKGNIPAYHLPVFLFIGLFIGQLVQSAVILILFSLEEQDGD